MEFDPIDLLTVQYDLVMIEWDPYVSHEIWFIWSAADVMVV